jgi:HEPN domain-containing protein
MNEKVETIRKWLAKAEEDLGTAIIIHQHIPEYRFITAFHCQQAVEKYLKCYLIFLDIEFRRVHDLVYLLELINAKEPIDDDFIERIIELEDYSVEIRYPEISIELTDAEIENAINIAKEVRTFVNSKMNIQL